MHPSLLETDQVDDFIVLRARVLTSTVRRRVVKDVLDAEGLALLEWQLLFSIARFGTCHVAYVTRHTSIDPAHGSRAATALEKRGLIHRTPDPRNLRRKLVSLTPQGEETVSRIWPKVRTITEEMTNRLTRPEFEELKRLLDLVNGAPLHVPAVQDVAGADARAADML